MKNLFYILTLSLGVIFVFSCEKENSLQDEMGEQLEMRKRGNGNNTVALCHLDAYTGEYHTIYVNENAVKAHLAHGDLPGECSGCDFACVFCGYLGYFDFDEPCEDYYGDGDYFCEYYQESYSYENCNDGEFISKGGSYIADRDYDNNQYCDGDDDENDYGAVHTYYQHIINDCGEETWYGSLGAWLEVVNDGTYEEVFDVHLSDWTKEMHDLAKYCAGIINGLAANMGLDDKCTFDDPLFNVNVDQLKDKKLEKKMIRQMIEDRIPPGEGKTIEE